MMSIMTVLKPQFALSIGMIVAGGSLVVGCGGLMHPEDYPTDGPTRTASSNPAEVTAGDFGHSWGLKIDHGTVSCSHDTNGDPVLVFKAPDGTEYALNKVDGNSGRPDIDRIADGSVGTLRTFAFAVCKVQ